MTPLVEAVEVVVAVCEAMGGPVELRLDGGRVFGPAFPGQRRPRKPWRLGIDPTAFAAVLQVEGIDAAWMPLEGGTQADALEMVGDSINAHAGIELQLAPGRTHRLAAPDAAAVAALGAIAPDGRLDWPAWAARLAGA